MKDEIFLFLPKDNLFNIQADFKTNFPILDAEIITPNSTDIKLDKKMGNLLYSSRNQVQKNQFL